MFDMADVIYSIFSDRAIPEDSEYKRMLNELVEKDNKFVSTLSEEQREQYNSINDILHDLQSETEFELVQFTLEFISQTINYTKQKD